MLQIHYFTLQTPKHCLRESQDLHSKMNFILSDPFSPMALSCRHAQTVGDGASNNKIDNVSLV